MSFAPTPPPPPPPFTPRESSLPKSLTFAAIGVGVGFGTCSLAGIAAGGHPFIGYFVGIGMTIFFVSLAVLLLTGLYMVGAAIIRSFKQ